MTASPDSGEQPSVFWLVLQPYGIHGIYTDEDEARGIARRTGNVLTHVPADGDYRNLTGNGGTQ